MLKQYLVNNFLFLGKQKCYLKAFYASSRPAKASYSQHGKDIFVWNIPRQYDLRDSIYVDVGANHPSNISNSGGCHLGSDTSAFQP